MSDLIDKLREEYEACVIGSSITRDLLRDAADEIERLRAALEKYGRHLSNCGLITGINNACDCGLIYSLRHPAGDAS